MKKLLFIILIITISFLFIEVVKADEISLIDSTLVLIEEPKLDFYDKPMSCGELLGTNITKVIHAGFRLVRIGSIIATIVIGMLTFASALIDGGAKEFNAAIKKCIWLAVVLMLIILIPVFLRTIGNLFHFDLCGIA